MTDAWSPSETPIFDRLLAKAPATLDDILDPEPILCSALIYAGSYIDPPEYCDEEAEPGSETCLVHTSRVEDEAGYYDDPPDWEPDWSDEHSHNL